MTEEKGLIKSKSASNDVIWIVDPLDGSLNFYRGIPNYCISIGLFYKNRPALGSIYDFHKNELFTGIAGDSITGAWLNGKRAEKSLKYVKHVRLTNPLLIRLDGRNGSALVEKPK